jgi:hypothetical protein
MHEASQTTLTDDVSDCRPASVMAYEQRYLTTLPPITIGDVVPDKRDVDGYVADRLPAGIIPGGAQ